MGRPKTGETPKRNVRVPDDVWNAAKKRAAQDHIKVSTVVVAALRQYAADGTIPLPGALTSRLIDQADARAAAQRRISLPDEIIALVREKAADAPSGPVFPRRVQMTTHVADGRALLDAAEVTRLLRAVAGSYRSSTVAEELEQIADQIDMTALTALDKQ